MLLLKKQMRKPNSKKLVKVLFETVIRLASETNTFASYADKLNLNFSLIGIGAIEGDAKYC